MSIKTQIKALGIREVVHFTTNRGIVGVLAEGGILSRRRLPTNSYLENVAYNNATFRPEANVYFDRAQDWLDYINLSVSEINGHFFDVSKRWHREQDVWWAVLAFHPEIMEDDGVYFATTNNKYANCQRAAGLSGFQALFADAVLRQGTWRAMRGARAPHLPTCQQAEVLYPGKLGLDRLYRIYVSEGDHSDTVKGWLREWGRIDVEVVIEPNKFRGVPN